MCCIKSETTENFVITDLKGNGKLGLGLSEGKALYPELVMTPIKTGLLTMSQLGIYGGIISAYTSSVSQYSFRVASTVYPNQLAIFVSQQKILHLLQYSIHAH